MRQRWLVGMLVTGCAVLYCAASRSEANDKTDTNAASRFSAEDRAYWALQPVERPNVPDVQNSPWVRNPIDAFILARLEAEGLAPAAEVDRRTLIRRVTFDLHGLPPTPEEVDRFVNDSAPNAYTRLIDRLLASPRYGERWARHWLDLVRYAESDGFKADDPRPNAWRYRDWVIRALNNDMPYNEFVAEQIAGDEIAPGDPDALVATGFLRHWPYEYNQAHVRQQWGNILNDITDVTGQVFLGLTVGCARCHDHKFDPILQKDYFRLQAFFAPIQPRDDMLLGTEQQRADYEQRLRGWEEATAELRAEIEALEAPYRDKVIAPRMSRFPKDIQAIVDKPADQRSPLEIQLAELAEKQLVATESEMTAKMKPDEKKRRQELLAELAKYDELRPKPLPAAMTVSDIGNEAPAVYIPGAGKAGAAPDAIPPGYLTILDADTAEVLSAADDATTRRRTALARWITDSENPLTARVIVNRLWQYHLGRGLVVTPSDFGRQGEPPTHPELLDWLATELVARGWSLKAMHRLMLTSAAYRQSSTPIRAASASERIAASDPASGVAQTGAARTPPSPPLVRGGDAGVPGVERSEPPAGASNPDPDNHLLHHMRPRRLTGEELRDAVLAVTGELNGTIGGPSVYPELPEGLSTTYTWDPTKDPHQRNRRSIYVFVKRNLRYPLFDAFDMPDTHESCARRNVTTTAPQALLLVNGQWMLERAAVLAGRLLREAGEDQTEIIRRAYRLTYSREPDDSEITSAVDFLRQQTDAIAQRLRSEVTLPPGTTDLETTARAAALVDFCHVLLNSNEFIYVD